MNLSCRWFELTAFEVKILSSRVLMGSEQRTRLIVELIRLQRSGVIFVEPSSVLKHVREIMLACYALVGLGS